MTKRDQNERRILEAAIEIIEAKGAAGLRIIDVLERSHTQAPMLYRVFRNREGLVIAAQRERYERQMAGHGNAIVDALEKSLDSTELRQRFTALLDEYLVVEYSHTRLTRVNVIGSSQNRPELVASIAQSDLMLFDKIALALQAAAARGVVRRDLAYREFVAWYLGQLNGRILIELDPSHYNQLTWNEIFRDATFSVLFDR